MSRFAIIIDMLKIAFTEPVCEKDYHNIVECLRQYATNRDSLEVERKVNESAGYPADYNPCEHMERIRFSFIFGTIPNSKVEYCLCAIQLKN
jgi:hypothetical protein